MSEAIASAALAGRLGGELEGRSDLLIEGVNTFDAAGPAEITFIAEAAYARRWGACRAAAAVVTRGLATDGHDPRHKALIIVPDAEIAAIELLRHFAPREAVPDVGVHPMAWVHGEAGVDPEARIGPHVSVDRGASIGPRVVLHAGVRIYSDVTIGADCVLHANCVVRERCRLGRRVILHQGVSVGADGFGYRPDAAGRGLVKAPHIGNVVIEDDVEIGANACIDRGKFGATIIGAGTKIDDLVMIGHNCRIGRACLIAALSGLGGSVELGEGVTVAGHVGIADHLSIGPGAVLAGKSGIMRDVPPGRRMFGYPADDMMQALRQVSALRKLPGVLRELARRQKTIDP